MSIFKFFGMEQQAPDMQISVPHCVKHTISVKLNPDTGELDGLPENWKIIIEHEFKESE